MDSRTMLKNLAIAATLGLAAFASWALTEYRAIDAPVALTLPR